MKYIKGKDWYQMTLLPPSVADYVNEDSPIRVIDAFVDNLDLHALGFKHTARQETGRPPYDPYYMLKLYIYGYFNRIRSSRMLMQEYKRNVEVIYLLGGLTPDFRTISHFRKDNRKPLRKVFTEFVKLELYTQELLAIDGTKVRAQKRSTGNRNAGNGYGQRI